MGKQSGKRYASAGNSVPNAEAHGQVEVSPAINDGNGTTGETGITASGNANGKSETGLQQLVSLVTKHNESYRADVINRAWHPDAEDGANIQTNLSDVPVLKGKTSYQLSTGEIVEL